MRVVVDNVEVALITRRNSEDAVLMSLANYNSLVETAHLLGTPANARHLEKSIASHRAGELRSVDPDVVDPGVMSAD